MAGPNPLPFDPIAEARRQWIDHGWEAAAPGMAAVTSVIRVEQILLARVTQVLAPFELTFARYELLVLLEYSRAGALPLGKIGARLQVHPTSITNAVDRLEAQGFVRRTPHPSDGRATLAELTPAGRQVVGRATTALNHEVFEPMDLQRADLDQLFALLEKVRRTAGDFT
jgi:DNA-binding MarR family transcriptional regulator